MFESASLVSGGHVAPNGSSSDPHFSQSRIDLTVETPVRLRDVPKLACIPKRLDGKGVHVATVFRWAQRGIHGIHLETIQCGGTKCTTVNAITHFFSRLGASLTPARPATSPSREKEIERACRDLEQLCQGQRKWRAMPNGSNGAAERS